MALAGTLRLPGALAGTVGTVAIRQNARLVAGIGAVLAARVRRAIGTYDSGNRQAVALVALAAAASTGQSGATRASGVRRQAWPLATH